MAKFIFIFSFLLLSVFFDNSEAGSGECPLPGQVYSCSPKCIQDTDCSYGKKCCPNLCNTKSCSETKTLGTVSGKHGSSSGTGVYCSNVKCSQYERCEFDSKTKRSKCVRT